MDASKCRWSLCVVNIVLSDRELGYHSVLHWRRYRLEAGTAQKRRFYTQVTVWTGGFYSGTLQQCQWTGAWNPAPLVTVEFSGERNVGSLAEGRFTQTLLGNRLRLNMSPDLTLASYVQYDTVSHSVGVNSRLQWRFRPVYSKKTEHPEWCTHKVPG